MAGSAAFLRLLSRLQALTIYYICQRHELKTVISVNMIILNRHLRMCLKKENIYMI